MIRVQREDFDFGAELARMSEGNTRVGGICGFVGLVRDMNDGAEIGTLTLEHYPGMTEKQLRRIDDEARSRWPLEDTLIVHRYGRLEPGDRIVLVAAASAHRQAAFEACHFLIDWLKIKAPFWKVETTTEGGRWVNFRKTDAEAAEQWKREEFEQPSGPARGSAKG